MITFDEIIESYNEETKLVPTNLNKKILLTVSIYSYLIKYNVKQKHLTLYMTNNKLEEVMH